jgi:hypothetical protein
MQKITGIILISKGRNSLSIKRFRPITLFKPGKVKKGAPKLIKIFLIK